MSAELYRRQIEQARRKIAGLLSDKAREQKRVADLQRKSNTASRAAARTKNTTIASSKLREAARHEEQIAKTAQKIADIERKIAQEEKKVTTAQKQLTQVEAHERRREQEAAKRAADAHRREMAKIAGTLDHHKTVLEELRKLPEKITILFLAANPLDQQQLRLDEEVRLIAEMIRKSEHRESLDLRSCWAVRAADLLQAINEHKPTIVHFSGHGSPSDEIVFQDDAGRTQTVSIDAIVQMMKACSGTIRFVFFNTCYSQRQAQAVIDHVDAAIGMNDAIEDEAARLFASQFYSSIGFALSVGRAVEQAKAALMLEGIPEEDTPELFLAPGLAEEDVVLVRPTEDVADDQNAEAPE